MLVPLVKNHYIRTEGAEGRMKNASQDSDLKPLTPDYPFSVSAFFKDGEIVLGPFPREASEPSDNADDWVTFSFPCTSESKRRLYLNGIEFPLWRWVPHWIRWLVWRYRYWRAQPMRYKGVK